MIQPTWFSITCHGPPYAKKSLCAIDYPCLKKSSAVCVCVCMYVCVIVCVSGWLAV